MKENAKKLKVGVLFGGRSAEHEVSLQSAFNVMKALDRDKYEVIPIGIDKTGKWHLGSGPEMIVNPTDPKRIRIKRSKDSVLINKDGQQTELVASGTGNVVQSVDVVFPVLHGTYGEDGTIQGLLKLVNVPFVGCDVLGSAVAMDKDVSKRLMRDAGIPVARFVTLSKSKAIDINDLESELGYPMFVKPANLGSSVGISKVRDSESLVKAIDKALEFDNKLVLEEAIEGREIECAVLGNEVPQASLPGEIIAQDNFYSYDAKYIDENGARLEIPAKLSEDEIRMIKDVAIKAYISNNCEGMSRVDMFLKSDGTVVMNEINTIPGFTNISMYPKLWELSGLPYGKLLDKLIELALARHERDGKLKTTNE